MTADGLRAPLSRDRIVAAALVLIESDGLAALSMRKLGAALGVEAMSLYNYVSNKRDLLSALADNLYADVLSRYDQAAAVASTWQDQARSMAFAYWDVARAHPQAFPLVSERPLDSSHGVAMLARCVDIFRDAGLSTEEAALAFHTAGAWMLGTITHERVLSGMLRSPDGTADDLYVADPPGRGVGLQFDLLDACRAQRPEERFAAGLEVLLAGLESLLTARHLSAH